MPNAPAHPEVQAEEDHLRNTLTILDRRTEAVGYMEISGPTAHDIASLHAQMVTIYRALQIARERVYFGRLDMLSEGAARPETHYIGRIGFDERGKIVVVDWRAPVARLFSRRRPGPVSFEAPEGTRRVDLRLKRHLVLQEEILQGIFDEYDTRPDSPTASEELRNLVDPDAYLRQVLSGRRDAQMGDIVATIQEHQDDLIRAEMRQVLLVQGAAGSGKTSVALHRLAYLLYPGNKLNINPDRCIIFGPNQLFLGYISNVLPGLGIGELPQTTLDTWALGWLGLADRPVVDSTLAALLGTSGRRHSAAEKQRMAERSRLKGSLRMGQVLERLTQWWRGRIAVPAQGLEFGKLGPLKVKAGLSRTRVAELHMSLRELPVMRHRQRLAEVMLEELMGNYLTAFKDETDTLTEQGEEMRARRQTLLGDVARLDEYAADAEREGDLDLERGEAAKSMTQGARGLRLLAEHFGRKGEKLILRTARVREDGQRANARAAVRETLRLALEAKLDEMWPPLQPEQALAGLLSDPRLLAQLGRGVLTEAEIDLLEQPASEEGAPLDLADLPALLYLHLLAHGLPAPLYDHIVVDEAQDAAPLYYAALRRYTRNGSLTILGDLAQGVYSYRGVSGWDEVHAAFEGMPYYFGDMRESYRSTHEIISFANRVLELLTPPGQTALLATPFERHGPPVALRRLAATAELAPALAEEIAALQKEGYANIAIIAKTDTQCAQLAADLQSAGVAAMQLVTGGDAPYEGGLVVLPVHLAKGLEFEAVLLAGADEANYPSAEFESRLLYVAVTRALHALRIFSVGSPSTLLELAGEGVTSAAAP